MSLMIIPIWFVWSEDYELRQALFGIWYLILLHVIIFLLEDNCFIMFINMNQPHVYRSPLPIVIIIWKDRIIQSNSLSFPELDLGNSESVN